MQSIIGHGEEMREKRFERTSNCFRFRGYLVSEQRRTLTWAWSRCSNKIISTKQIEWKRKVSTTSTNSQGRNISISGDYFNPFLSIFFESRVHFYGKRALWRPRFAREDGGAPGHLRLKSYLHIHAYSHPLRIRAWMSLRPNARLVVHHLLVLFSIPKAPWDFPRFPSLWIDLNRTVKLDVFSHEYASPISFYSI